MNPHQISCWMRRAPIYFPLGTAWLPEKLRHFQAHQTWTLEQTRGTDTFPVALLPLRGANRQEQAVSEQGENSELNTNPQISLYSIKKPTKQKTHTPKTNKQKPKTDKQTKTHKKTKQVFTLSAICSEKFLSPNLRGPRNDPRGQMSSSRQKPGCCLQDVGSWVIPTPYFIVFLFFFLPVDCNYLPKEMK